VAVKGQNLVPAGDIRIWRNAYVYFISPNQVNILTPPDALTESVQVQLANGTASPPR